MKSTRQNCPIIDVALPGAQAFYTCRGDCNPGDPYSGFNACFYVGDVEDKTSRCRREAAEALGLDSPDRLILPRQTHSNTVAVVTPDDIDSPIEGVDALVTSSPEIALGINTADCIPLLLSDPEAHVIAAVHSGWRGTTGRIAARAVEAMTISGARPENIHAFIGPHICPECFEVGEEVVEMFDKGFGEWRDIVIRPAASGLRPHIDLARAVTLTLEEAGLLRENISGNAPCSKCHPDSLFSARRLGTSSGRTLSAIRIEN